MPAAVRAPGSRASPDARRGYPSPRELLARHGLRAKKSWGQSFLMDRGALARIVGAAAPAPEDTVVEIGAGLGTLTAALAERAGRVIAVERDPEMVAVLRHELGGMPAVDVRAEDALEIDLEALSRAAGRRVVIVGNLPYQIASPLLFRIVTAGAAVSRAVVMVQRELAERLVASPGGRTYGRLSVMAQQAAEAEILFHVPPGAFHPRPAVTSSVVRLTPRALPRAAVRDARVFERVVRAAFGTRRKMLRRALAAEFGAAPLQRALLASGIDGRRRAETLTIGELGRLADALTPPARPDPDHARAAGG